MGDKFREVAIDRETGGVSIYWFTPGGRLRRIDLDRADAFKALAQLALGLAETERVTPPTSGAALSDAGRGSDG